MSKKNCFLSIIIGIYFPFPVMANTCIEKSENLVQTGNTYLEKASNIYQNITTLLDVYNSSLRLHNTLEQMKTSPMYGEPVGSRDRYEERQRQMYRRFLYNLEKTMQFYSQVEPCYPGYQRMQELIQEIEIVYEQETLELIDLMD